MAIQTGVAVPKGKGFPGMWAAIVGAIVVGLLLATIVAGALSDRGATQAPNRGTFIPATTTVQYPRAPYRAPAQPASFPRAPYRAADAVKAAHAEARG